MSNCTLFLEHSSLWTSLFRSPFSFSLFLLTKPQIQKLTSEWSSKRIMAFYDWRSNFNLTILNFMVGLIKMNWNRKVYHARERNIIHRKILVKGGIWYLYREIKICWKVEWYSKARYSGSIFHSTSVFHYPSTAGATLMPS